MVSEKIMRPRHLQKLTLYIMPLNQRLKNTNSWCFIVPRGKLPEMPGILLPRSLLLRILVPILSANQAGERLCVCLCVSLVPACYTRKTEAWGWSEGRGGWETETEGWETKMEALQGVIVKSHPGKWQDASLSPLLPPALLNSWCDWEPCTSCLCRKME